MNRSFKQHTLIIGKCDHNGSGRRDYTASVDWSVTLDGHCPEIEDRAIPAYVRGVCRKILATSEVAK